jgi:hypothetical protein
VDNGLRSGFHRPAPRIIVNPDAATGDSGSVDAIAGKLELPLTMPHRRRSEESAIVCARHSVYILTALVANPDSARGKRTAN